MIEPTIEALTTSCRPCVEREEGDDQLRRVAEGDVEQAADAGTRARRQLLGRPAHQRRRGDDPQRRGGEDDRRRGAGELERDRDRDQRHQQVGPAVGRAQEGGVHRLCWCYICATGWRSSAGRRCVWALPQAFADRRPGRSAVRRSHWRPSRRSQSRSCRSPLESDQAFEQIAEAFAAGGGFEQFDRVDRRASGRGLRAASRSTAPEISCSSLTSPSESSRSTSTFSSPCLSVRSSVRRRACG